MPAVTDRINDDVLVEFEALLKKELSKANPSRKKEWIATISTLLAPLAAATFYFIGSIAAKEITKEQWVQDLLISEGIIGNFFTGKFALDATLSELFAKPGVFRKISGRSLISNGALNIAAGVISMTVAITNYFLSTQGGEQDQMSSWVTALNMASNALFASSMYYGAKKMMSGAQYVWQWTKMYFSPQSRDLHDIRTALVHAIDTKLSEPESLRQLLSLLDEDNGEQGASEGNILDKLFEGVESDTSESSDDTHDTAPLLDEQSTSGWKGGFKRTFDAMAIVTMVFATTGFVYQTAVGTYELVAGVSKVGAFVAAALVASVAAIGETGFNVNAARGLRPELEKIYDAILDKDYGVIASSLAAFVSMALSGVSGYEANSATWKFGGPHSELIAVIAGYIGLASVSTVNTVYGAQALRNFLKEFKCCCQSQEAKKMATLLGRLHDFKQSLHDMTDSQLKALIGKGVISQQVLEKLNIRPETYGSFLPGNNASDIPEVPTAPSNSNLPACPFLENQAQIEVVVTGGADTTTDQRVHSPA